jgi:hypothetical protein
LDIWLVAVVVVMAVVLAVMLIRSTKGLSAAKKRLARYQSIVDVEDERDRIGAKRDEHTRIIADRRTKWQTEYAETIAELEALNKQLVSTRDQAAMETFGVYEPEFDFGDPDDYKYGLPLRVRCAERRCREDQPEHDSHMDLWGESLWRRDATDEGIVSVLPSTIGWPSSRQVADQR